MFLSFSGYAHAQDLDNLSGRWRIVERQCSGGYPPRDQFRLERDWASMSFFSGRYDGHTQINGCNYWLTGRYEARERVLRVFDLRGASDCTQQPPLQRQASQIFEIKEQRLKLFSAPMNANGVCLAGDILEVTYQLY